MSSALPPGWSAHQTPEGRWYFSRQAPDGQVQTQWHHPAGPPPAAAPVPQHSSHPHHPQEQHRKQHPGGASATPSGAPRMSQLAARYVLQQPTEFKLQEKAFSLSGDSFSVKRVDTGKSTFKVRGNALSFKDSKAIEDANGQPIYKMTENIISLRGRMIISDPATKHAVMTLRKKSIIPGFGARVIQAWAGDSDDGKPYLEVKGDFLRKDFSVKECATGRTLATIKRKSFTLSNLLLEKDTYIIRVEPGVDTALLVFFVVAADEQYRDDGNRKGLSSFF